MLNFAPKMFVSHIYCWSSSHHGCCQKLGLIPVVLLSRRNGKIFAPTALMSEVLKEIGCRLWSQFQCDCAFFATFSITFEREEVFSCHFGPQNTTYLLLPCRNSTNIAWGVCHLFKQHYTAKVIYCNHAHAILHVGLPSRTTLTWIQLIPVKP